MINYIIQVVLFQTLFLVVYDLVLSKETFFSKNRWYLLVTGAGAFIIPFLKVPTFQQTITREVGFALPEIVISPQHVIEKTAMYQSIDYVSLVFWSGLAFFATLFAVKMIKLFWLILNNHKEEREEYTLVTLSNSKKAFSFFNYIFLGDLVAKSEREKIIAHEQIHSQQKHTIDLLMFELLKTVMWFNPLLYIYQQKISAVHEYISDDFVSNFNSDIPKQIKLASGKHRIIMILLVNKEGNVVDVKVKAPHPELEKEGKRILNLLPKMKPGTQRGKPVSIKYTLPIAIHVE